MVAVLRRETLQQVALLLDDPYPPESGELERELAGLRKLKIDGWRLVYEVDEEDRTVRIWAIRPRGPKTYKGLR